MTKTERKIADLSPEQRAILERRLLERLESSRSTLEPIPRRSTAAEAPLSFAQQRLWTIDQLEPGLPSYNVGRAYRLRGPLSIAAVDYALRQLLTRHEILRTVYQTHNGVPVQIVLDRTEPAIDLRDLSDLPDSKREQVARDLAEAENSRPFDLAHGPILRCMLIRLDPADHLLVVVIHHIATDGWSEGIFWREFESLYKGYVAGEVVSLSDQKVQYADFAAWQREALTEETLATSLDYWRNVISGLAPLALPTDHPRSLKPSRRGSRSRFRLGSTLSQQLRDFAQQNRMTPYMVLLANLQLLLYQISGQTDFAVGTPVAGRNRVELEPVIGFFVNTLLLRADLGGDPTFRTLLARVQHHVSNAFNHQDVPFDLLVKVLNPQRAPNRQPLFDVMFQFVRNESMGWSLPDIEIAPVSMDNGTAKFDLSVTLSEREGEIGGSIVYSDDLFDSSTVDRFVGQFRVLLATAIAEPDETLSRILKQAGDDLHALLDTWNDTATQYPREATIQSLFEEQVVCRPDMTALYSEGRAISYAELNGQANRIAHSLVQNCLAHGARVGLWMRRSPHVIAAILGVLKAGGVYVPLDTTYPASRLAFMLEDAGVSHVLTDLELYDSVPRTGAALLRVEDLLADAQWEGSQNPSLTGQADDLAYIMYTSGSTGQPKGVEITHRGVVRLVCNTNYLELGPSQTLIQLAPLAFDASTFEIWAALLHGAALVLAPDGLPDFEVLESLIARHSVTALWLTTGLFNTVVDYHPHLLRKVRYVLTGGEVMSVSHVRKAQAFSPETLIINFYGPTENTTFTTYYPVPQPLSDIVTAVPIGRPIANTTVHILDQDLTPVPVGATGELYTGGDGLARGYHDRAELNAERFIPDPSRPQQRLYRTGDLARWMPDGNIAFVGRVDDQIKLRGHRIEPGEIQHRLEEHPAVRHSYVVRDESEEAGGRLVAYIVPADRVKPDSKELRDFLSEVLPPPMVPSTFVVLDRLPLTPNGKVDRRALPLPGIYRSDDGHSRRKTQSSLEETIATVFREFLRVDDLSLTDDFFSLGGHSLLAVQVASRISEQTGFKVPSGMLFEYGSIESLAQALVAQLDKESEEVVPLPSSAPAPGMPPGSSASAGSSGTSMSAEPIEVVLTELWGDLLHLNQVGREDNFFELGGHSLSAIQLVAKIEERLGVKLSPTVLFEAPTIAQLASRIEQSSSGNTDELLVPIQPNGTLPPFFCVHGFGGGVVGYADLAGALGRERPFYGIQAVGMSGNAPPDSSIEEMAAHYLTAVRAVQPHGPYRIGGYCFGGIVAFEMARQLEGSGERVEALAIIEGYAPKRFQQRLSRSSLERWRVVWHNIPYWWHEYWSLGVNGWRQRLDQKRRRWVGRWTVGPRHSQDVDVAAHVPDDLSLLPEHRRLLMEHHLRALQGYHPEPLNGSLILYAARSKTISSALFGSGDPQHGWGALALQGVVVRKVDGGHHNLHLKPFAEELGSALAADLLVADG